MFARFWQPGDYRTSRELSRPATSRIQAGAYKARVEIDHREHGVLRHASGNAGLDRIKIDAGKLIEKVGLGSTKQMRDDEVVPIRRKAVFIAKNPHAHAMIKSTNLTLRKSVYAHARN